MFTCAGKSIAKDFKRMLCLDAKKGLNFINGRRTVPTAKTDVFRKYNPATEELLFQFPSSDKDDVGDAVLSAKQAFKTWSTKSPRERGQILIATAFKIRDNLEHIAKIEVLDTGKPMYEARIDIAGCADTFEYYGGVAATISGTYHQLPESNFAMVQREPLGVVAGIGAWNYPFQVMTWKVAPALACGNTFVYKPSELTPSTSVLLAEILKDSGVPDGVVNVVQGSSKTGEYICTHPDISKVTFTGSVETGKKIVKSCADTMKKVTMELGGKSALVVFPDSDIIAAVKATLLGNFFTQGEVCSNCTRIFVHRSILDQFTSELVSATTKLKVGDPFRSDTTVGAVINRQHGLKILKYIESAKSEGAKVACGGQIVHFDAPTELNGCFISPCVLTNCSDEMTIVKEEVFGPVVSILGFNSEEEVIARANASPYGLAAGVMTKDLQRAHRVASALEAGIVWINNYNVFPPEVPFGGYKMSGYGRENGLAAIDNFTQLKTVYVHMESDIDCPLYQS